jgi:hypothetical protein
MTWSVQLTGRESGQVRPGAGLAKAANPALVCLGQKMLAILGDERERHLGGANAIETYETNRGWDPGG